MIQKQSVEDVQNLDITEVIGKFMTLTKKGTNYQGLCPFHKEKSPSFSVTPSKGTYKCYGCGKTGDAINFVMELKQLDFPSAVKAIAADHNINIVMENDSAETRAKATHQELLFSANKLAFEWFRKNLNHKENSTALAYVKSRWNDEMIGAFGIGFAPDSWDGLKNHAKANGISENILLETGLLSESAGKRFDYFRGRIIFPIFNANSNVIGFTGRDLSGNKDTPKYFNTRQTEIFTKGKNLFGLHLAYKTIREQKSAYLVEGNADVIRMHQIGLTNTVSSGGTALTLEQISELKRYTGSVTLIGDSDKPGQAAVIKNGKMIIEAGMFCKVIPLPADGEKQDPDSFFNVGEQFETYTAKNTHDYIVWQACVQKVKCNNPEYKTHVIDELSYLVTRLPISSHGIYIEELSRLIRPKKAWEDRIRQLLSEEPKEEKADHSQDIPKHVNLSEWEKYGFYIDNNCYYFKCMGHPKRGSNFIMEPLVHIASVINSKRLYRITNTFGFFHVIELLQKDMISLSNFKLRVESLGNFLFEGTESDLNKIKRSLYENTESCVGIDQLGWQKAGFWAWSDGIFNSKFMPTDPNGIVKHENKNYYLPSSSDIYKAEEGLFVSERRFKFSPGEISLSEYSEKLINVFGENAIFGLCFYFASLYRDHIVKLFGFFPILNLFGPKGAGKTELAISLLQFFGHQSKGPNITNSTNAALADHVALFSNAVCHIDEYSNNLEYEKIEFLKGLWDGTGRTRMNMDKDKKKETTRVDCGITLSGQQMPTADIALFSRLIFLSFSIVEYTDVQKAAFNELKGLEKLGLTHITHELLLHREQFVREYSSNYSLASVELNDALKHVMIEDRIFRNWLVILAAYRTLREVITVPWEYPKLLEMAAKLIIRQNKETKKSNELSIFWEIVEFLTNDGQIKDGIDFKVLTVSKLKTDIIKITSDWNPPKNVLFLNPSRVFQLYRMHGLKTKENILTIKTLEYYLANSKEYLGRKHSCRFKVPNDQRDVEDDVLEFDRKGNPIKKKKSKVASAFVFEYDPLPISILNINDVQLFESDTEEPGEEPPS